MCMACVPPHVLDTQGTTNIKVVTTKRDIECRVGSEIVLIKARELLMQIRERTDVIFMGLDFEHD